MRRKPKRYHHWDSNLHLWETFTLKSDVLHGSPVFGQLEKRHVGKKACGKKAVAVLACRLLAVVVLASRHLAVNKKGI